MQVRTVIIVEGIADLVMMLTKLAVGLATNSAAIIGDAVHSLTDLTNNIIAFIAIRISEQPSDSDHHYGHSKFEQLAVFALAVLLAVVAIELVLNALSNYGQAVHQSYLGLAVMIGMLAINIGLTVWQHHWADKLESDLLHADAKHTLSDVLTTIAVILGWQLAALGYYWMDTVFALLVAGIILYLAFELFQRAVPTLVDHSSHDPAELLAKVQQVDQVQQVTQIRARGNRATSCADVTIAVDPLLSTEAAHQITEKIESVLADNFGIHDVIVHVEPEKAVNLRDE